jgi:hypothetical protein
MALGLEDWYVRQCNGEWEHRYGVNITTLDNPGWRVSIDLNDTAKQNVSQAKVAIERTDDDWIFYWVAENRFEIACGPRNLTEAVRLFVEWFDSQ